MRRPREGGSVNYCCARGGCPSCLARHAVRQMRARRREAREASRVLLGNAEHPPDKQNAIVDETVKTYP